MNPLDRLEWLDAVNRHPDMTPAGRSVAIVLACRARDGVCWPSQKSIADDCGLTDRSVRTGIETLRTAGFLEVASHAIGDRPDRRVNRYRLTHDRKNTSAIEAGTTGSVLPLSTPTTGSVLPLFEGNDRKPTSGTTGSLLPLEQGIEQRINTSGKTSIPSELEGLSLFEADKKLVDSFPNLLKSWKRAFPEINLRKEIGKAHGWMLANPNRPKKNLARFLSGWIGRARPEPEDANELATEAGHRVTCKLWGLDPETLEPINGENHAS